MVILHCSVIMSREWITKLTGRQLKTQLSQRELETSGSKPELVERLNKYLDGKLATAGGAHSDIVNHVNDAPPGSVTVSYTNL